MELTNITLIALSLITLVCVSISILVIPIIKRKNSQEAIKQVMIFVDIAVSAAEQIFNTDQGKEKKQYVLDYITKQLNSLGLTIDLETIENMIESAVLKLHNQLLDTVKQD